MPVVIWWVRRDLRLYDNAALQAAIATGAPGTTVAPVFVLDPALLTAARAAEKRVAFLFGGLRSLAADLAARGGRLIVRQGDPVVEIPRLVAELDAVAVVAEADPWPYARARDAAVAAALGAAHPLHLTGGLTVHPYDALVKADGSPYAVFTPFSRAWRGLPPPTADLLTPPPERFAALPPVASLPLPETSALPTEAPFPPGEAEALRRLRAFAVGSHAPIHAYAARRNRLDLDGTSQLSPYLRFGMVAAVRAAVVAQEAAASARDGEARRGADTWLTELIWREFYQAVLYHQPHVLTEAFQPARRAIPWRNDPAEYAAWCEARTGFPVVDAAIRQLVATGFMHNRARMITASFLVKDLLIDWRWGERFFMEHLLDADPAANNGGWQWTAGVGTDAAPYFRIFNPTLQSARFDPAGAYIRRWLPELAGAPEKYIHAPATMPPAVQAAAGCVIGRDYPAPIVDHAAARARVLAAYRGG